MKKSHQKNNYNKLLTTLIYYAYEYTRIYIYIYTNVYKNANQINNMFLIFNIIKITITLIKH